MKWIAITAITSAVFASSVLAQDHIRCQNAIFGPCGDSSRPREMNCCDYGYCQPWNTGYYQCLHKPALCPTQETDIDYAGNDIKTLYGLRPDQCCDECAKIPTCKVYTFVNENPDGKTACYLKTAATGRVEKKGAVSGVVAEVPVTQCPFEEIYTEYVGHDISNFAGITQTECCDKCVATTGCVAYSYFALQNQGCFLKSSAADKIDSVFAVSGQLKEAPPPANCPIEEKGFDYYGNDISDTAGVTQTECCDKCTVTVGCAAYTYIPRSRTCYLKKSAAGKVANVGAVSGKIKDTPPPDKCPTEEKGFDYYGNDIKALFGVTQTECCDSCSTTTGCAAYTYIPATKACYLKKSAAGKVARADAVSGLLKDAPPTHCPPQEADTDYYGNDMGSKVGITNDECCDACAATAGCTAYTYIASAKACYLKNSDAGKVAKIGAVSGKLKDAPPPANCPVQEKDVDYYGHDLKMLSGITNAQCCDACSTLTGCAAYTFIAKGDDGKSACFLKDSSAGKIAKVGAVSSTLKCPTPLMGQCGSSATGVLCCPAGSYCQPWNPAYFQCVALPDVAKCPRIESGVDFYGGDIEVQYGLSPAECCDACFTNAKCQVYTFINYIGGTKSACYLKNGLVERRNKPEAISGFKEYH